MAMKECPYGYRPCTRCHSGKTNHHETDTARAREFRPPGSAKKRLKDQVDLTVATVLAAINREIDQFRRELNGARRGYRDAHLNSRLDDMEQRLILAIDKKD